MKRSFWILVIASLVALPLGLMAQDEAEEERDLLELNLYGGFSIPAGGIKDFSDTLGAKTGIGGGFDFGVFIKQNITLGLGFSYTTFDIDNDNPVVTQKHQLFSPNVFVRYYFPSSGDLVPFVHGRVGLDFPKFSTEVLDNGTLKFRELAYSPSLAAGLGAGIFVYTSDYSGFFLEADYRQTFADSAEKEYKGVDYIFGENYGLIDIRAGIHILFGSDE